MKLITVHVIPLSDYNVLKVHTSKCYIFSGVCVCVCVCACVCVLILIHVTSGVTLCTGSDVEIYNCP